jgi:hypothetical protein
MNVEETIEKIKTLYDSAPTGLWELREQIRKLEAEGNQQIGLRHVKCGGRIVETRVAPLLLHRKCLKCGAEGVVEKTLVTTVTREHDEWGGDFTVAPREGQWVIVEPLVKRDTEEWQKKYNELRNKYEEIEQKQEEILRKIQLEYQKLAQFLDFRVVKDDELSGYIYYSDGSKYDTIEKKFYPSPSFAKLQQKYGALLLKLLDVVSEN